MGKMGRFWFKKYNINNTFNSVLVSDEYLNIIFYVEISSDSDDEWIYKMLYCTIQYKK